MKTIGVNYIWTDVAYPCNKLANAMLITSTISFQIVTCGLNPILLLVGLPCNVLCMVVFKRQGLEDRMNVSLFSLAFVDFWVILLW